MTRPPRGRDDLLDRLGQQVLAVGQAKLQAAVDLGEAEDVEAPGVLARLEAAPGDVGDGGIDAVDLGRAPAAQQPSEVRHDALVGEALGQRPRHAVEAQNEHAPLGHVVNPPLGSSLEAGAARLPDRPRRRPWFAYGSRRSLARGAS